MLGTTAIRNAWISRMSLRALLISVVTTLLSLLYYINQRLFAGLVVSNYTYRGYPFWFLLQVYWRPFGNFPARYQYMFYPFNFMVDLAFWFAVGFTLLFMLHMGMKKH